MAPSVLKASALLGSFHDFQGLVSPQFSTFLTRPGPKAVKLDIVSNNRLDLLSPGYIFITPYPDGNKDFVGGPQIFESDGTLVWYGYETVHGKGLNLHVCDYLGGLGDHLCYNDGAESQQGGHTTGVNRFFDDTYTQVGDDFGAASNMTAPDAHELNTPTGGKGGSLLQTVYQTVGANLTAYGGPEAGYVLSGCLQDVDVATKNATFTWCSFDHVPLNQSQLLLNPPGNNIVGTGTQDRPYDYFHINSADKDESGDYLVSARHCDTVYKIAGLKSPNPKSIIWNLGGKNNSFHFEGSLNFSRQHTGRFQGTTGNVSLISLFDNGSDGDDKAIPTAKASSGMVIAVDTSKMSASLVEQYVQPDGRFAISQGSLQLLPNGNRFIGWGSVGGISEHSRSGSGEDLLYYARFVGQSYRAWKSPFVAHPATRPDILAYSQNCTAPLFVYVSWNGVTEAKFWRFWTGNSNSTSAFAPAGVYRKGGFETLIRLNSTSFTRYVYAEALDSAGKVLNSTTTVPTFVPNTNLTSSCNSLYCVGKSDYTLADSSATAC